MKTKITIGLIFGLAIQTQAQQPPALAYPPNGGQTNPDFWSRAGNLGNGVNNQNNLFGTKWNSPIYTITGNNFNAMSYRMKVNAIFTSPFTQYSINGLGWNQGVNTTGYVLIGSNGNSITDNKPLYNVKGAFSLLHLNGATRSNAYQEYGYRAWMQTGITLTGNRDLSYIGLRQVGTLEDITETTVTWADNPQNQAPGPDDFCFRFTGISGGGVPTAISTSNLISNNDLDGLHIARFTGDGMFGLGNTFGINTTGTPANLYVRPQSLAHYSLSDLRSVWQQFTNRNIAINSGTGENASDGLRIGILGNNNTNINGTAMLYNQEERPILFSTNANTNAVNMLGGQSIERVRIMSVATPTKISGGYGVYNPGNLAGNLTRVSISHNPAAPVTRPLSLLHLGYNTSNNIFGGPQVDGWRPWMDVGAFISYNSDNMYIGMKDEGNDRKDAIINWGDNQPNAQNGPDHLRFIFTASNTTIFNPGDSVSKSLNGLETMRIVAFKDTTYYVKDTSGNILDSTTTYGRVGIGDFTAAGVNQEPTHKLDVVGNGRFRYLPDSLYYRDSTVSKYVMVDEKGVLRWGNGGGLGAVCGDTVSGNLTADTHIDLNNFNYYFTNNDLLGVNHVGIGYVCGDSLPAKLSVTQQHPDSISVGSSTIAILGLNLDSAAVPGLIFTGVQGMATALQSQGKVINRGGYFTASGAQDIRGVVANLNDTSANLFSAYSGEFNASSSAKDNISVMAVANGGGPQTHNTAFSGVAFNSPKTNVGVDVLANSAANPTAQSTGVAGTAYGSSNSNIGGAFRAYKASSGRTIGVIGYGSGSTIGAIPSYPNPVIIGVYGVVDSVAGAAPAFAGFFDGDVYINGPSSGTGFAVTSSDQQFKKDTAAISAGYADSILSKLKPKSFYFDTTNNYGLKFSAKKQFGLIAQEVETVLPNLVGATSKPSMVDASGNTVTQGVSYKTLAYTEFIPLLIKGHQAQNEKLDSLLQNQPTNTDSLQAQIDTLKNEVDSLFTINTITNNKVDSLENVVNDLNNRLSQLENCLSNLLPLLCQINQSALQQNSQETQRQLSQVINVTLTNDENIVLNQNVPNPFAESTVITYSIPASVQKAQLLFYDGYGKLMKTVDINERGAGRVNVFGSDLSSGRYSYTLVADGNVVATKFMVKTQD